MKRLGIGLLALCAACEGGTDTGNPVDGGGPDSDNAEPPEDCLERPRDISPDEVTPLGMRAADLIDWVRGEHRQRLSWERDRGVGQVVTYGPESGIGEIAFAVEPTGGLRYVERDPRQPGDDSDVSICEDLIEVDVTLGVTTAGGALDERFETTLRATSADVAYGAVNVSTSELAGALMVDMALEGFVPAGPASLELEVALTRHGIRGSLDASQPLAWAELRDRAQTFPAFLAVFPPAGSCPESTLEVPLDAALRGVSAVSALERLNASSPSTANPGDSPLRLSITSASASACLRVSGWRPSSLRFELPARLTLDAPAANLDGDVEVALNATAVSGVLQRVGARASVESSDPAVLATLPAAYAITTPIDFSSYEGGSFELSVTALSTETSGSLRVLGLTYPACLDAPPDAMPMTGANGSQIPCRAGPESSEELFGVTWRGD
jgi:hypothetical protein